MHIVISLKIILELFCVLAAMRGCLRKRNCAKYIFLSSPAVAGSKLLYVSIRHKLPYNICTQCKQIYNTAEQNGERKHLTTIFFFKKYIHEMGNIHSSKHQNTYSLKGCINTNWPFPKSLLLIRMLNGYLILPQEEENWPDTEKRNTFISEGRSLWLIGKICMILVFYNFYK